jgi:2-polyprenyl-6-methoxyphenol hydroxylase-like FAD-dependent oxidoreductase
LVNGRARYVFGKTV